jgi:hypothetical protein
MAAVGRRDLKSLFEAKKWDRRSIFLEIFESSVTKQRINQEVMAPG